MANIFTEKQQEMIKKCIIDIMRRLDAQTKKTKNLQRMAYLARTDGIESDEYRMLQRLYKDPTVVCFGDTMIELYKIGKRKKFNDEK